MKLLQRAGQPANSGPSTTAGLCCVSVTTRQPCADRVKGIWMIRYRGLRQRFCMKSVSILQPSRARTKPPHGGARRWFMSYEKNCRRLERGGARQKPLTIQGLPSAPNPMSPAISTMAWRRGASFAGGAGRANIGAPPWQRARTHSTRINVVESSVAPADRGVRASRWTMPGLSGHPASIGCLYKT